LIFYSTLTQDIYYILAAVVIAVIMTLSIFIYTSVHKRKKPKEELLDASFLDELTTALGGSSNIVLASREHQRLKIKVNDLKKIQAPLLEKLKLGAFLKGKEVTLLIKHHTEKVEKHLNANRKGA
jgi:phosphotransferase system IIB component